MPSSKTTLNCEEQKPISILTYKDCHLTLYPLKNPRTSSGDVSTCVQSISAIVALTDPGSTCTFIGMARGTEINQITIKLMLFREFNK